MTGTVPSTASRAPFTIELSRLDTFERHLLPLLRLFLTSLERPESLAWRDAYSNAAGQWGEAIGLAIAQAFFPVVMSAQSARKDAIEYYDPKCGDASDVMTADELALLETLHHMRRDNTGAARTTIETLTKGRMNPDLIRSALRFAIRFHETDCQRIRPAPPLLRVVSG